MSGSSYYSKHYEPHACNHAGLQRSLLCRCGCLVNVELSAVQQAQHLCPCAHECSPVTTLSGVSAVQHPMFFKSCSDWTLANLPVLGTPSARWQWPKLSASCTMTRSESPSPSSANMSSPTMPRSMSPSRSLRTTSVARWNHTSRPGICWKEGQVHCVTAGVADSQSDVTN